MFHEPLIYECTSQKNPSYYFTPRYSSAFLYQYLLLCVLGKCFTQTKASFLEKTVREDLIATASLNGRVASAVFSDDLG